MSQESDLQFPRDEWIRQLVVQSLAEDIGTGDVSTAVTATAGGPAHGRVIARQDGVIAGLPLLTQVCAQLSSELVVDVLEPDGSAVRTGTVVARVDGPADAMLSGERTALNFLQHLSGIATATAAFVARTAGTGCHVLDTRKTLPGYRALAKYAVRAGGGHNHRLGLYDRVMLKDNHWAAADGAIARLVARARREYPDLQIEVEVDDLEQLSLVLPLAVDWILLDNFTPAQIRSAVALREQSPARGVTLFEASGNIGLENIADYAQAGVDAASVGWLTHSAPALDIALEMDLGTDAQPGVDS